MMDIDKCSLTRFPTPVLGQVAKPVDQITDQIRQLVHKMIDLMIENKGVGLAAPQVGVGLRIFVFSIDGTKENAKVYINPELDLSGPLQSNNEGCLSLPGIEASIKRYKKCTVTATDLDGNRFTEEAQGLQIRGFQHELDHLEGIMIKDRMGQAARIITRKRLRQLEKEFNEEAGQ